MCFEIREKRKVTLLLVVLFQVSVSGFIQLSPPPSRGAAVSFWLISLSYGVALGTNAGLNVRILAYSPNVQCHYGQMYHDMGTCSNLVDAMSTGAASAVFTGDNTVSARKTFIPPGGKIIKSGV